MVFRRHIAVLALVSAASGCAGGSSYGGLLLQSLFSLAAVVLLLLAMVKLSGRWLRPSHGIEQIEVLERKWVSQRSALVVVRAGSKVLLLSEGPGGLSTLSELPADEWQSAGFGALLERVEDGDAADAEEANKSHSRDDSPEIREVA